MNTKALSDLEFAAVLELLCDLTSTPPGRAHAADLTPAFEPAAVRRLNDLTIEATRHLKERGTLPFGTIVDPQPLLDRLALEGSVLEPQEILELLQVMKSGRGLKSSLAEVRGAFPLLWGQARELPEIGNLIRFLDGKIGATGEVLDHASDELRRLRRELHQRTTRLQTALETITGRPEIARILQDDFVSIRSERHVIPIRAEARFALPGIVHGVSGSGATVFVEPLDTVDINNEIVTLREQESHEVGRLLQEYSDLLRGRLPELRGLRNAVGELDLIMAKGRLARSMRACPVEPSEDGDLTLAAARHPLVEISLHSQGERIVPLGLSIPTGARVLLISGPNTGGKTVALKTVGLLALMFQSGLQVPALRARLPVYRTVSIDIGDRQSISDRLSTFSARVKSIAEIAGACEPPALILLDEVGTGTDPEEGVALGIATVDYFRTRGATVIATTHLEALKAYASATDACLNAAMQFDEETLTPTYRLVQGIPGRSGAIDIAERLGLPAEILEAARARRGRAGAEVAAYLARLQDMHADLERRLQSVALDQARLETERKTLREEFAARESRLRQAMAEELELALGSMRAEGKQYLSTIKDRELAQRLRRSEAKAAAALRAETRRLIRRVSEPAPDGNRPSGELVKGMAVEVRGLKLRGIVEEIQGDRAVLLVRGKRFTVPRADCRPQIGAGRPDSRPGPSLPRGVTLNRRTSAAATEVHLLGMTADEALDRVDKFLDDAYLGGIGEVRVIHGVGSGRLRKAVREFLRRHPHVETFAAAPDEKGGGGVTVVTLRP